MDMTVSLVQFRGGESTRALSFCPSSSIVMVFASLSSTTTVVVVHRRCHHPPSLSSSTVVIIVHHCRHVATSSSVRFHRHRLVAVVVCCRHRRIASSSPNVAEGEGQWLAGVPVAGRNVLTCTTVTSLPPGGVDVPRRLLHALSTRQALT